MIYGDNSSYKRLILETLFNYYDAPKVFLKKIFNYYMPIIQSRWYRMWTCILVSAGILL